MPGPSKVATLPRLNLSKELTPDQISSQINRWADYVQTAMNELGNRTSSLGQTSDVQKKFLTSSPIVTVNSGSGNMQQQPISSTSPRQPILPGPPKAVSQDNLNDGTHFARVTTSALTSNQIDFSKSGFQNKNLDNVGDGPNFKRILNVNADNTFHASTSLNGTGGIPANTISANFISVTTTTPTSSASSAALFSWSIGTLQRQDGSGIRIFPPSTLFSTAAAPTLSQVAGGTLAARTRFVRIGLVIDHEIVSVSAESSLAISANNLLQVASPTAAAGYEGWVPLIGTATSAETLESVHGDTATLGGVLPIAFGTNYTEPTTGFVALGVALNALHSTPFTSAGATSQGQLVLNLSPSTTFFAYPYYGITSDNPEFLPTGVISFIPQANAGNSGFFTAKNVSAAIAQCGDGIAALSTGAYSFTTPAAGSTGSASGGGGGGGGRALE